jgi:hypothetical protein
MRRCDRLSRRLRGTMQDENQYKKNAGARRVQPKVSAKQAAQRSQDHSGRKPRKNANTH